MEQFDVIIIGGGPAGVAGGIYASRKRLNALFLTKDFGGQSINSGEIENFIGHKKVSGIEFAKMLEDHLRAQDHIHIKDGVMVTDIAEEKDGLVVRTDDGKEYRTRTLLYTLGSHYRRLGIPGESELEGKGVFYCSICDAPLMKNKSVAVIGGGNSGAEAVIDLLPYASSITVLQHSDALKMEEIYKERIGKEEKASVILNAETERIFGSPLVEGLEYKDLTTGEKHTLEVSGVFVAIGWEPNSSLLKDLVKTNERGNIIVDHQTFQTSHPRIWAAGDVTDIRFKQINPAIGDGVKAMLSIYDELK
jgi:NADH-dependent peroxiredoxin subunit F